VRDRTDYNRRYYLENRERIRAQQARYYASNRARITERRAPGQRIRWHRVGYLRRLDRIVDNLIARFHL
jgi:hypothetical protein